MIRVDTSTAELRRKVTVVIPTRNRPAYLARALNYLADRGFEGPIVVSDASDDPREWLTPLAQRYQGLLDFRMTRFPPDVPVLEKIRASVASVDSPYVAMSADDDFAVPSALYEGTRILSQNPSYRATLGSALTFTTAGGVASGPIEDIGEYRQSGVEQDTASARLVSHLTNYTTTWYSVRRTEELLADWTVLDAARLQDLNFVELLMSSLLAIRGKISKMNCLYMARQGHVPRQYALPRPIEWLGDKDWPLNYQRFRDHLATEVSAVDGIPLADATELVRKALGAYLASYLAGSYSPQLLDGRRVRSRFVATARRVLKATRLGSGAYAFLKRNAPGILRSSRLRVPSAADSFEFEAIRRAIETHA